MGYELKGNLRYTPAPEDLNCWRKLLTELVLPLRIPRISSILLATLLKVISHVRTGLPNFGNSGLNSAERQELLHKCVLMASQDQLPRIHAAIIDLLLVVKAKPEAIPLISL